MGGAPTFGRGDRGHPGRGSRGAAPGGTESVTFGDGRGGGALFISDANWGRSWGDAPSSDQTFLDRFDLIMNQDNASYKSDRSTQDFVIGGVDRGDHPVLAGPDGRVGTGDDVNVFDGEGVSPLTLAHRLDGVDPLVLARAENDGGQADVLWKPGGGNA